MASPGSCRREGWVEIVQSVGHGAFSPAVRIDDETHLDVSHDRTPNEAIFHRRLGANRQRAQAVSVSKPGSAAESHHAACRHHGWVGFVGPGAAIFGRSTYQMRMLRLVGHLDVVELDIQVLIHRVQLSRDGEVVLSSN